MGPKKGRTATIPRPGPDWSWVALEDITDDSDITEEHLRKAMGLETARPCRNKLADEATVIDLDDTADEGQETDGQRSDQTVSTSKKKNRKGGASREAWGPPCGISWCQNNMLCLNHIAGKALLSSLSVQWNAKNARENLIKSARFRAPPLDRKDYGAPVGLRNLGATCYIWYYNEALRAGVYACATAEGQDEASPVYSLYRSKALQRFLMPSRRCQNSPIFQLALTFAALQTSETKYYDPAGLVNALRLDTGNQQDASEFSKLFMTHLQNEFSKQNNPLVKTLISDQFEGDLEYVTRCQKCGFKSARTEKFLELEITLEDNCTLSDRLDHLLSPEELSGANAYLCSQCDSLQKAKRKINLTHLPPTLHFSLLRFVYDARLGDRKKSKAKVEFPAKIDMSIWLNEDDKQSRQEPAWYELRGVVEHRGASAHRGHFVCQVYDCEHNQWYLCNDETVEPISSLTEVSSSASSKPSSKNGANIKRNDAVFQTSTNAYMLVYQCKAENRPSRVGKTGAPGELAFSAPTGRLAKKVAEMKRDYIAACETYEMENLKLENIINKKLEVMQVWNTPSAERDVSPKLQGPTPYQNNETQGNGHQELPLENRHNIGSEASAVTDGLLQTNPIRAEGAVPDDLPQDNIESMKVSQNGSSLALEFSNKGIICEHGKLCPNQTENTKIISTAFGCLASLMDVSEIPHFSLASAVCQECLGEEEERGKASAGAVEKARDEKKKLKDMTHMTFLTTPKREIFAGIPSYLLSVEFVNSWLEWINDPIEVPRPKFSNGKLFCKHHQLLVDPDWKPDHESGLFVVIYEAFWSKIASLYDVPVEETVAVTRPEKKSRHSEPVMTTIPVCQDCWKQKRSTSEIKLNLEEMDSLADIRRHVQMINNESDDISESGSAKRKNGGIDMYSHPSKRQRVTRSRKKRSLELCIQRHESVQELKMKVKEKWGIFPIFQHIFYGKVELAENTLLLRDVGVLADDTLYIVCDEMEGGLEAAMNGVDEEEVTGDAAESLAGFGGTALFGLSTTAETSDSIPGTNAADSNAPVKDLSMDIVEYVNLQSYNNRSNLYLPES
ncbi:hypothetical protein QFC22_000473 [Naganishia vaughanmartiniae]|uniref:Uncharacterized protein n=1 Tax=Naganishia vaughanmartiniae TaxID=1424756 RepID=A0ACC2XNF9_9TREE|nr:hypothetical protein QFC22_000473 [Naganishia vaughanmartiniae]